MCVRIHDMIAPATCSENPNKWIPGNTCASFFVSIFSGNFLEKPCATLGQHLRKGGATLEQGFSRKLRQKVASSNRGLRVVVITGCSLYNTLSYKFYFVLLCTESKQVITHI